MVAVLITYHYAQMPLHGFARGQELKVTFENS